MKKLLSVFALMLIISIGNLTKVQAQTWISYETPAEVSAVAVSQTSLFVFGGINYFETILPLPADPNDIEWVTDYVPTGIGPISQAGLVGNELFILRDDQLWSRTGTGNWHLEFDGVMNMKADGERLFVWFGDIINIYTGSQWILDGSPENISTLAFEGENILTFDYDRTMYLNGSYWSAFEDFNAIDVTLDNGVYTAVGTVIGDYAAWYSSALDQSFKYVHILSLGELSSVASADGKQFAAGSLTDKGVIFDVADLSDYTVFANPIMQIRSNGSTIAGIDGDEVHVREGQITGINSGTAVTNSQDIIIIAPNPIANQQIRFISDAEVGAEVYNQVGAKVAKFHAQIGMNTFALNLPAGIYFLRTNAGASEKFIVQ